jgi:hypothetical protein
LGGFPCEVGTGRARFWLPLDRRVGGGMSMTVKANVHYGAPTDAAHFETYFVGTHAPLAKKMPGL